jgi:hypothetical protein
MGCTAPSVAPQAAGGLGDDGGVHEQLLAVGDLPLSTGLPPWMAAVMVLGWLALIVVAVGMLRWRRAVRADRLGRHARRTTAGRRPEPPADRQVGPGTDVELW